MNTWGKQILWLLMLVLATGVAGYAISLLLFVEIAPPFLKEGLNNGDLRYYSHFIGGSVALILGALQFSGKLRANYPKLHRWLGRGYLLAVLASGVAGLLMGISSAGNLATDIGFTSLAVCWLATGIMAFVRIREGNVKQHKKWIIRNYALTYAAVSLRIYLPLLLGVAQMDFQDAYIIVAWACWVPNLILAELIFNRTHWVEKSAKHTDKSAVLKNS